MIVAYSFSSDALPEILRSRWAPPRCDRPHGQHRYLDVVVDVRFAYFASKGFTPGTSARTASARVRRDEVDYYREMHRWRFHGEPHDRGIEPGRLALPAAQRDPQGRRRARARITSRAAGWTSRRVSCRAPREARRRPSRPPESEDFRRLNPTARPPAVDKPAPIPCVNPSGAVHESLLRAAAPALFLPLPPSRRPSSLADERAVLELVRWDDPVRRDHRARLAPSSSSPGTT